MKTNEINPIGKNAIIGEINDIIINICINQTEKKIENYKDIIDNKIMQFEEKIFGNNFIDSKIKEICEDKILKCNLFEEKLEKIEESLRQKKNDDFNLKFNKFELKIQKNFDNKINKITEDFGNKFKKMVNLQPKFEGMLEENNIIDSEKIECNYYKN